MFASVQEEVSSQDTELGDTVMVAVGTDTVNCVVDVPMLVLPLYVVSVSVKVTLLALFVRIAFLNPAGIERLAEVLELVALALPNR